MVLRLFPHFPPSGSTYTPSEAGNELDMELGEEEVEEESGGGGSEGRAEETSTMEEDRYVIVVVVPVLEAYSAWARSGSLLPGLLSGGSSKLTLYVNFCPGSQ